MTKAGRAVIERALRKPPSDIRLFLLHGPDEAGSRALAAMLGDALGAEAERVDLAPQLLKQDPALLADEAASRSLFGTARHSRIEGGGEECLAAVDALLDATAAGNPVVLIARALKRDSGLLKRAFASAAVLACASYSPEGIDADRMIAEIARDAGLLLPPEGARLLAAASGGNRAIAAGEIEKLAIFADVSADRPGSLPAGAIEALGIDHQEGRLGRLAELVASGRDRDVTEELGRLAAEGIEGIAALRPVLRFTLQLAAARAAIETPDARVSRGGFAGEREQVDRQVGRWRSSRAGAALARLLAAERAIKSAGGSGVPYAEEALLAIARGAARDR